MACPFQRSGAARGLPYTPGLALSTQMLKSVRIPHPQRPVVLCPPTSVALLLNQYRIFAALSPACTALVVAIRHIARKCDPSAPTCPHVPSALGEPTEWALTLHPEALAG